MTENEMRMKYAGAIGLLCQCSGEVDEDTRESIELAVSEWCESTGWEMTRTLDHIDIRPPNG